jgi:hypothetical protein
MTKEKAQKIFRSWQEYQEIADKLHTIFTIVPESFLPYPVEVLGEALNVIAKDYFDAGNKETADAIQKTMVRYLTGYHLSFSDGMLAATELKLTDAEALKRMKKSLDLMLDNPKLLEVQLKNLRKSRDSWMEFKGVNTKKKAVQTGDEWAQSLVDNLNSNIVKENQE